jgi:hypothetical protein
MPNEVTQSMGGTRATTLAAIASAANTAHGCQRRRPTNITTTKAKLKTDISTHAPR